MTDLFKMLKSKKADAPQAGPVECMGNDDEKLLVQPIAVVARPKPKKQKVAEKVKPLPEAQAKPKRGRPLKAGGPMSAAERAKAYRARKRAEQEPS